LTLSISTPLIRQRPPGWKLPWSCFTALKKEGKARFIGVSTHSGAEQVVNEITKNGVYDVALVAFQLHNGARQRAAGCTGPRRQQGRRFGGDEDPGRRYGEAGSEAAQIACAIQSDGVTEVGVAESILHDGNSGFTNFEQLEQNFSAARNLAYTPAEKDFLGDKNFRANAEFCQQCSKCRADCPLQVDIPTLMRSHMYAVQYSNHGLARETLASISAGRGLDACAACGSCKATCRETVKHCAQDRRSETDYLGRSVPGLTDEWKCARIPMGIRAPMLVPEFLIGHLGTCVLHARAE